MEKKQSQVFVEKCSYCNKEFPETLYEAQAISWKKSHEDYCPKNPSNKRK